MEKRLLILPISTLLIVVVALGLTRLAAEDNTPTDEFRPSQWRLPGFLSEASGLARVDENYLLSHNDEKGKVYRIRLEDIQIDKIAQIGKPSLHADFEGVAIDGQTVYLSNSGGIVYRLGSFSFDGEDQVVEAEKIDTDLKAACELEGLHYLDGYLLLPCKSPIDNVYRKHLTVFEHHLASGRTDVRFSIHEDDIAGLGNTDATAIDFHDGVYYIISGRNLVLVNAEDLSTVAYKLRKKFHDRPEGLAIMADGSLYIVDDSNGGDGILTRYQSLDELKLKD